MPVKVYAFNVLFVNKTLPEWIDNWHQQKSVAIWYCIMFDE